MASHGSPSTSRKELKFPPGIFRSSATIVSEKDSESVTREIWTEYTFHENGSYEMAGYPPIKEKGVVVVKEKIGNEYTVKFTQREQISAKGNWNPADIEGVVKFTGDLLSFTWNAKLYVHCDKQHEIEEKKSFGDSDERPEKQKKEHKNK